jgi:23S rRNA-/tRNA-specific pseudouridylate synthase
MRFHACLLPSLHMRATSTPACVLTPRCWRVAPSQGKVRLDAYLAAKLPQASRARLQASIKEGLVTVNGRPQAKSSYAVRLGDTVGCSVLPPPPLEAAPEELPLDIVYEDEHLLVINKVRMPLPPCAL